MSYTVVEFPVASGETLPSIAAVPTIWVVSNVPNDGGAGCWWPPYCSATKAIAREEKPDISKWHCHTGVKIKHTYGEALFFFNL